MKFVQEHFTKHHFFHAPHKWFLAFLLSPFHAAELHYQKRYHLRFAHARKLFLFDLFLILCVFFTAGTTIFFYFYDPTITKYISLGLTSPQEKIRNGEVITYNIEYQNKSTERLIDASIALDLPKGFVINSVEPHDLFHEQTKTFVLPKLVPGSTGKASVSGRFFGNSDEKVFTIAHFSYKQESRGVIEEKVATITTAPRGSVLTTLVTTADEIINGGTTDVKVDLTNTGDVPLENINLQLGLPTGSITKREGEITDKKIWNLTSPLLPKATAQLHFDFKPTGLAKGSMTEISATPRIQIQGTTLTLDKTITHPWKVLSPEVDFDSAFEAAPSFLAPGKTVKANLTIKNNGNMALSDVSITIAPGQSIDTAKMVNLNPGSVDKAGFHITAKHHAALGEIAPGAVVNISLTVPVKNTLTGQNLSLRLNPILSAHLKNTGGEFTQSSQTGEIKIGTKLGLDASARYYTVDGDQLGRGPLPPQVGKETKYAAIMYITNSTNAVENMSFSAELPAGIVWSGKSSASRGKEPSFDASSRRVSWSALQIAPGETVSIFLQLALTPNRNQVGTTPLLLKNISVRGTDMFTNQEVNASSRDVDVSMPNDAIARVKGVKVRE